MIRRKKIIWALLVVLSTSQPACKHEHLTEQPNKKIEHQAKLSKVLLVNRKNLSF